VHLQRIQERLLDLILEALGPPVPEEPADVHPFMAARLRRGVVVEGRTEGGVRDALRVARTKVRSGSTPRETGRSRFGSANPAVGSWQEAHACPAGLREIFVEEDLLPMDASSASLAAKTGSTTSPHARMVTIRGFMAPLLGRVVLGMNPIIPLISR